MAKKPDWMTPEGPKWRRLASREIYEIMADRLGIPTDECVFIDDIPANVDGATRAGMKGLLYTTNHQLEVDLARVLGNGDA